MNTLKKERVLGIIPARYASSRFPGKPLADIKGMSMIERVYRQAKKAAWLDEVIVATDDRRIAGAVDSFGGQAVMTSEEHPSGTDRCMEVVSTTAGNWDVVINIQGDEPLINPLQIDQLVQCMVNGRHGIGTLVKEITREEEIHNPNVVKVVINADMEALYFSRSAIPYNRSAEAGHWLSASSYFKHIGIYGYRTGTLRAITTLEPSALEQTEALEQLRWLENGYRIMTAVSNFENIAVDTPDDLEKVLRLVE